MKKCKLCKRTFSKDAKGPWCHACVNRILMLLSINQKLLADAVETVERIRQQLREAKAAGKNPDATEVPGPYWGLEL